MRACEEGVAWCISAIGCGWDVNGMGWAQWMVHTPSPSFLLGSLFGSLAPWSSYPRFEKREDELRG